MSTVIVALIILLGVASRIQLNYYAISPGDAQPVNPLIHVPADKAHRVQNSVLLTDVYLSPVSLLQIVPDWLSSDTDIVSSDEILGPATPADQLTDQGYLDMAQSQSFAKAAAFRTLGYAVPVQNRGALVYGVAPDAPSSSVLRVAQIITALNGTPTTSTCGLIAALHPYRAGQTVKLSVEQSTVTPNAVVVPGKTVEESVTLGTPPKDETATAASGCPGVTGPSRGYLGVSLETYQQFTYPFPVSIDTTQIGGPSAGLAMTLGVLDKLTSGSLTGGKVIAATGTIDEAGDVGDVGGVPQKTIAVERAGATIFLVPVQEYSAAKSKATPGLHVYAVSSLTQALAVLRHNGGTVPTTAPTTTTTSNGG